MDDLLRLFEAKSENMNTVLGSYNIMDELTGGIADREIPVQSFLRRIGEFQSVLRKDPP
jgi:hypothetical protein